MNEVFEQVAETIADAFKLDDNKIPLIKTGLVIVTVVVVAKYVKSLVVTR